MFTKGAKGHKQKNNNTFLLFRAISNLVLRRVLKNTTTVIFQFSLVVVKKGKPNESTRIAFSIYSYCMLYLCTEMKLCISSLYLFKKHV